MKKTFLAACLFVAITSCNNEGGDAASGDTTGPKTPDGVVNQNVISTDTAAYNVDTTNAKAKELADSVFKK